MAKRLALVIIALLLAAWFYDAGWVETRRLTIDTREFRLKRLPPQLDGFRIAQLSDFHTTKYGDLERRAIDATMKLRPDMIVITGDCVGWRFQRPTDARNAAWKQMMRDLRAPYGVWAIPGNNDQENIEPLKNAGTNLLLNRNRYIRVRGSGFWLVGAVCPSDIPQISVAFAGLPREGLKLFLVHSADSLLSAPHIATGVDLALTGHTHGGQILFPVIGPLYSPLKSGLPLEGAFHVGKVSVYTNEGIGINTVPFRFRCPPQVSLIILRADRT